MLGRALPRDLGPSLVHVHFHDWDLLDARRSLALRAALRVLRLRRAPLSLDRLAAELDTAPERSFAALAA
jgi:hypothetical protein